MSQKILYLDLFGQQDRVNPRNKGLSGFVINQAWDTETKDLAADRDPSRHRRSFLTILPLSLIIKTSGVGTVVPASNGRL